MARPEVVVGVDGSPESRDVPRLRRARRVAGGDLPNAETAVTDQWRARVDPAAEPSAVAATRNDAKVPLPDLEQHVNLARLHLHQALARALHTLDCATGSICDFEHRLAQHRARLRELGYPAL
jgi:hypothetical protein